MNSPATACPFCASPRLRPHWRKGGYAFTRCAACELIFVDPVPSEAEVAAFYEGAFFSGAGGAGYVNYDREQRWRTRNYRRDLAVMESLQPGGRMLDVGCATGSFMKICGPNWQTYGQEVSHFAGEQARQVFGQDRIFIGKLGDAPFPEQSFDFITLWETINHMVDPRTELRDMARFCKPGGYLALSVGDVGCALARVMGRYWYHVTPPIHIWFFTRVTMARILDEAGFDIVRCDYPGKYVDVATAIERMKDACPVKPMLAFTRWAGRQGWTGRYLYINLMDTMYVYARKR